MRTRRNGGNGGYVGRARPAAIGIKGRPISTAKPTSMDGGWELSDVLPGAAAVSGQPRWWHAYFDEPMHSQKGRGCRDALVAHRGARSNDG